MLTEKEKDRIRAEEVFRDEARQELEADKPSPSRGKRLWALLNSSFALWFLSSVVIGGIAAGVTAYKADRSEQNHKQEIQRRLNTEIAGRLSEALVSLDITKEKIEHGGEIFYPSQICNNVVDYLDNRFILNPANARDFSSSPEYKSRTFRSLIFELSTVTDAAALPALRKALADYKQITDVVDRNWGEKLDKDQALRTIKQSSEIIKDMQQNTYLTKLHLFN